MSDAEFLLSCLRDARISELATSGNPAWIWAADGSEILWANPTGAAIFGAQSPAEIAGRRFPADDSSASQIARFAGSLPQRGGARLERLRGFGAGFGRALVCSCSRVPLGARTGVLVAAIEPAGPNLTLSERARRILAGLNGAFAALSADGSVLAANDAAAQRTGEVSVGALAPRLASLAQDTKDAAAEDVTTGIILRRIGTGAAAIILVEYPPLEGRPAASTIEELPSADAPAQIVSTASENAADIATAKEFQPEAVRTAAAAAEKHAGRRHPLRFVWQMDEELRFTTDSEEFRDLVGADTAAHFGSRWDDIARALALDPEGGISRAAATRDTWSGIVVSWPVEGSAERLPVELSGLPVFDRNRIFRGYRGFGVCRDVARLADILTERETQPAVSQPAAVTLVAPPAPVLTVVPRSENIVPFRAPEERRATTALSAGEHSAFSELARELTSRLKVQEQAADDAQAADDIFVPADETPPEKSAPTEAIDAPRDPFDRERPVLDRLPVGVLIYRHTQFIFANRAFLDWTGYSTLSDFEHSGGLDNLFLETGKQPTDAGPGGGQALVIETPSGDRRPTEARLFTIPWGGATAMALMLVPAGAAAANEEGTIRELRMILDIGTDGVAVLNAQGEIVTANQGAQTLFGRNERQIVGRPLEDLIAPESRSAARSYFDRVTRNGATAAEGCELVGSGAHGRLVPLYLTLGHLNGGQKICAVFRDITQWKNAEHELVGARRSAEKASAAKSEFLAKVSHEIRTPLNAIIGFSDLMMNERFGPIGNERYRDYLKDIHASGGHLLSLLNDLLDLSKIEAGKLELSFGSVNLNDLTQQSVALMQPQANRERIIIRTSLPANLPLVVADARSVRQIILNLLSNSIKFTGAGGQVIISTATNDNGDVVLRVRDTGAGMSERDIATALEPFRQLASSSRPDIAGTGLGLPLTKALAEANRANFSIKSAVNSGTLVEIAFPAMRMSAE